MTASVSVIPIEGLPEIATGDDVAALISARADLVEGDVVVVSSKLISKAWGLRCPDRDEAVAQSTTRVVAERVGHESIARIVQATAGPVMAAGGVDSSNVGPDGDYLVLPGDPDAAAAELRERLMRDGNVNDLGVVISDTAGRAWRVGHCDFALGSSGVMPVDDWRGRTDADGRDLSVTMRAIVDEIAAAADLVKGKAERIGAAIVRGLPAVVRNDSPGAASLLRAPGADWFRFGHVESVRLALGITPGSPAATQVGIAAIAPEPLLDRIHRAVAAARFDQDDGDLAFDVGADRVEISGMPQDGYRRGVLTARFQIAAWAESVGTEVVDDGTRTVIHLRDADPITSEGGAATTGAAPDAAEPSPPRQ